MVCTLNGRCSGICGEASHREKRLTLAECGRNGRFNNNNMMMMMMNILKTIMFC